MAGMPSVIDPVGQWSDQTNVGAGPFVDTAANLPMASTAWDPNLTATVIFGTGTGVEYVAQRFTVSHKGNSSRVELTSDAEGTPVDTMTVEIQSDAAGAPSGTVLGTGSLLPSAAVTWYVWTVSADLDPGVPYWLVAHRSGAASAVNYYRWQKIAPTGLWSSYPHPRATRDYAGGWVVKDLAGGEAQIFRIYDAATGSVIYVPLPDKINNLVLMWRSADAGVTWDVADAGSSPFLSSTAGLQFVSGSHDTVNKIITLAFATTTDLYRTKGFSTTLGSWSGFSNVDAPTASLGITGVGAAWASRRHDLVANQLYYQAATELVSGTNYRRIKLYSHRTANNFDHDVITGTTTAAGTQIHYDARYGLSDYGTTHRFHCVWTQSNDTSLRTRYATRQASTLTWTAAIVLGAVDQTANYPVGVGTRFGPAGTGSSIALTWADADGTTKMAWAVSLGSETLANWTIVTLFATSSEIVDSNPVVVTPSSAGATPVFYAARVAPTTRTVEYAYDAVAGTYCTPLPWRGDPNVVSGGLSVAYVLGRFALVYLDDAVVPPRVMYDQTWIFEAKRSLGAGTYTSVIDTRVDAYDPDHPFTIAIDNDAAVGVSANVTLFTGDNATEQPIEMTQLGTDGTAGDGLAVAGDARRYLKTVLTLSGTMTCGVVGY